MKYIDADRLRARIEKYLTFDNNIDTAFYIGRRDAERNILAIIDSLQKEQPEVDYNIIPLPEERMVSYIAYCLRREDDDCNCPTCGKHVTGLRHFPYYYDRENNDVYFATVCPKCGKIIISKE